MISTIALALALQFGPGVDTIVIKRLIVDNEAAAITMVALMSGNISYGPVNVSVSQNETRVKIKFDF